MPVDDLAVGRAGTSVARWPRHVHAVHRRWRQLQIYTARSISQVCNFLSFHGVCDLYRKKVGPTRHEGIVSLLLGLIGARE